MCFCSVTSKSLMIVEPFFTWNKLYELEANWFDLFFSDNLQLAIKIQLSRTLTESKQTFWRRTVILPEKVEISLKYSAKWMN